MRLHEFIAREKRNILQCSFHKLAQLSPLHERAEIEDGLAPLLDEIERALQRHAGLPVESPLPGHSEEAAELGRHRLISITDSSPQ